MRVAPRNKIDFTRRFAQGEFGNRPRTWDTWRELDESGFVGKVTMRSRVPGGPCHYGMSVNSLRASQDSSMGEFHYNEAMPDHLLVVQGNIYTIDSEVRLTYSCEPNLRFREAMGDPHGRYADGLLAHSILRTHLSPSDYEDFLWLVETYEDAKVLEFSTYRIDVGVLPYRRTVWWEVRNY